MGMMINYIVCRVNFNKIYLLYNQYLRASYTFLDWRMTVKHKKVKKQEL